MTSPKLLKYDIVNVFLANQDPFTGNPLAVIYGAESLSTEQCQAFGRQFNLSEITFPTKVSKDDSEYHVRIFTPGSEIPFAGHPTLGTCFALLHNGLQASKQKATQHSEAGPTILSFSSSLGSPWQPARIGMRATARFVSDRLDFLPSHMMPVLGLKEEHSAAVKFVRRASCGLGWVYACLNDPENVHNAKVAADKLEAWSYALKDSLNEEGHWIHGIVAFTIDDKGKDQDLAIRARVFFSEDGALTEDSATGSAALGLGLVLHKEGLLHGRSYSILQGVEMKKPSELFGRTEVDETGEGVAVHVYGDVVKVGSGELRIPSN